MAQDAGVPGNSMEESRQFEAYLREVGLSVEALDALPRQLMKVETRIKAVKFIQRGYPSTDWLAMVTAETPDGHVVGFSGGGGLGNSIQLLTKHLKSGSIKFKEDTYAAK